MCNNRAGWYANRFSNQMGGYGPWNNRFGKQVPVNIQENEADFQLSLYAPGLQKEAFAVSVKDDLLIVAYHPQGENRSSASNFTRREYRDEPFERSFALNGKVEVERIAASYADGILKVVLAKNPDHNKPAQKITVA